MHHNQNINITFKNKLKSPHNELWRWFCERHPGARMSVPSSCPHSLPLRAPSDAASCHSPARRVSRESAKAQGLHVTGWMRSELENHWQRHPRDTAPGRDKGKNGNCHRYYRGAVWQPWYVIIIRVSPPLNTGWDSRALLRTSFFYGPGGLRFNL